MNLFTDLLDLNDEKSYVALLMQEGLSQHEAENAFNSLRAVYEKYQPAFDNLFRTRHNRDNPYQVIESDIGPRISESRTMVYDVLDYHNQGATRGEIALNFNLKLSQVDVALEYIDRHRAALEAELVEIKERMAEEEAQSRAKQEELERKVHSLPMTKERKAFYELKKANRHK